MVRLAVCVGDWEVGCCLEPPRRGARVAWLLRLAQEPLLDEPERLQRLDALATPLPQWEGQTAGTWPVRLDVRGVSVYWEAPRPVPHGRVQVEGTLHLGQHGEVPAQFPPVVGTVTRVRMADTLYEERPPGSRSWWPVVPLDVVYEDVEEAPKYFPAGEVSTWTRRSANSLLVDLDVRPDERPLG